jgi:hypothetical protein
MPLSCGSAAQHGSHCSLGFSFVAWVMATVGWCIGLPGRCTAHARCLGNLADTTLDFPDYRIAHPPPTNVLAHAHHDVPNCPQGLAAVYISCSPQTVTMSVFAE